MKSHQTLWTSDSSAQGGTDFDNWFNGQPNNYNFNENYGILLMVNKSSKCRIMFFIQYLNTGFWNDGTANGDNNPAWQRQQTLCIRGNYPSRLTRKNSICSRFYDSKIFPRFWLKLSIQFFSQNLLVCVATLKCGLK